MYYLLKLQILLAVISLSIKGHAGGQIKYVHHELPPLYTFDDYDLCFQRGNTKLMSTYCLVYAEIIPDTSSELWQKITTHSNESKLYFQHDRLFFGTCMERCSNFTQNIKESIFNKDNILQNEITQYFELVHKRPLDIEMRTNYTSMIHNCLNKDFEDKYNLKLRTFVEYCETKDDYRPVEKDPAESFLYKLLQLIVLLTILSTVYDYGLKSKQPEESRTNYFFKNDLEDIRSRLFTSFCISRNYYRITQPYRGELGNTFRYLDGFRSVCTLIVLQAHTLIIQCFQIKNPEYFEQTFSTFWGKMYLNKLEVIEIFFVMSGLLMFTKFTESRLVTPQTSWMKCMKFYILMLIARLMRFLPSVALSHLVNATVLYRFVDGPYWRHVSETYRVFSRENWWKNILMFNNFSPKDTSMTHTWYLAADFQLFAVYMFILIFTAKYPHYKKRIYTSMAILAIAVPISISYILKSEAMFTVTGEAYRYGFFNDNSKHFYNLHIPSYTNLGGYLVGILCGEFYWNTLRKKENEHIRQRIRKYYRIGTFLSLSAAFLIAYFGSVVHLKEASIWTALYSGLYRNLWSVFVCAIPVLVMSCKTNLITYEFCCLPIFRVLARLSFQMYLWHIQILIIANAFHRYPVHMSGLYLFGQSIITITVSIVIAFFVCLLVEYPIAQCLQPLLPRRTKSKVTAEEDTKQTKVQ